MTHPVSRPIGPETRSSTLNECPWSRPHLWPGGTAGRRCAASKVNSLKISTCDSSADPKQLVGLEADPPWRVGEAVLDDALSVVSDGWTIHRLEKEVLETKPGELL